MKRIINFFTNLFGIKKPQKYKFNCWLCSGKSVFVCKPKKKINYFKVDCCRCGIANKVRIKT